MPVVPTRDPSSVITEVNATAPQSSLDGLSSGLQQAGNALGDVGLDIQMRENADYVMQAEITLRDAERAHRNSVEARKGIDAFGVTAESEEWWGETVQKFSSELKNDAQRQLFNDVAQQRRQVSLDTISGYEAAERRNSFNQSSASVIEGAIEDAAESAYNPAAIALERDRIKETIADLSDSNGWTPEMTEAELSKAVTAMHGAVVNSLIADSPPAAEAYFKEYRNEINGTERAKMDKMITARMIDHKASALAEKYYADEDSYDEANKKVRKIKDPDLKKATREAVRRLYADDVWGRQAEEGLAADEAWKVMADQGTVEDVKRLGIWDRLAGDVRMRLLNYERQTTSNKISDRTDDDLNQLTEVERLIDGNRIRTLEDLTPYLPFFQEATRERLRKKIKENTIVNSKLLLEAFEARNDNNKRDSGDAWDDKMWAKWGRFETYVRDRVREGASAKDVNEFASEFFMDDAGYTTRNKPFWPDPTDMDTAAKSGMADSFVFSAPEELANELYDAAQILGSNADQLYSRSGRDTISNLKKLNEPVTKAALVRGELLRTLGLPRNTQNIAAYDILAAANVSISAESIHIAINEAPAKLRENGKQISAATIAEYVRLRLNEQRKPIDYSTGGGI